MVQLLKHSQTSLATFSKLHCNGFPWFMCPSIPSFNIHLKQASGYLNFWRLARLNSLPPGAQMPHPRGGFDTFFFFFLKEKICKLDFQVIDQTLPSGHGRWISTRGLPGGQDVESSNWSVHYVVMDCLDLSAKQQIEQLTFIWVLYFTPFVSWFPVLLSSNSFHFRLSILQIH